MSKKKSTMTLKDFHGGSIPSDLPLPSAPGVSVRPPERSGGWGSTARQDYHRPRPGSTGGAGSAVRGLDERGPFLPNPAHIGRHFDEDERKPFDAVAAPRRLAADPAPLRSDQIRPVSHVLASAPAVHVSQVAPASAFPAVSQSSNAWATRKEVVGDPPAALYSGGTVDASRFVQASAIDKISSGRWHSKPTPPLDLGAARVQETDAIDQRFRQSARVADDGEKEKRRVWGVNAEGAREHDRGRALVHPEAKDGNSAELYVDENRPTSNEGRFTGSQIHQDVSERPKLKLLPRTKPMDSTETRALDEKQSYQPFMDVDHGANAHEAHGNMIQAKLESPGADGGGQPVERPRLYLRPRSQPIEQSDESFEKDRKSVFGGARPRELVLKERGMDAVAADNLDLLPATNRIRQDNLKADIKLESAAMTTSPGDKAHILQLEQRKGRSLERRDNRAIAEKVDVQRNSLKNENWRNTKEIEKLQEQPRQEPETWRKPIEEPKPDVSVMRIGKVASPLELAQAFSRSVSDSKSDDRTNQRSQPGRIRVPFSRLTDTREFYSGPTKRQINGY